MLTIDKKASYLRVAILLAPCFLVFSCSPTLDERDERPERPQNSTGEYVGPGGFGQACNPTKMESPKAQTIGLGASVYGAPGPLDAAIIAGTNNFRVRHQRNPLQCEAGLSKIALAHSLEMARHNQFGHTNKAGLTAFGRFKNVYPNFRGTVAENIALRTIRFPNYQPRDLWLRNSKYHDTVAQSFVTMWQNSPSHRENMLRSNITHIGVGTALRGDTLFVTQVFGGLSSP